MSYIDIGVQKQKGGYMMNKYTAVIGSMTVALKAQKILLKASINSSVVKIKSSATGNGCSYGLEFDSIQYSNIRHILETSNIKVSRYLMGGGTM